MPLSRGAIGWTVICEFSIPRHAPLFCFSVLPCCKPLRVTGTWLSDIVRPFIYSGKYKGAIAACSWVDPEGKGTGGLDLSGKSQVTIGFLKHSGMDHPRAALDPLGKGSNCFSREVHTTLCKIRGYDFKIKTLS